MKKVMYLLGMFLCFGMTTGVAQINLPNQITVSSGPGGDVNRVFLDEYCRLRQLFRLRIANLDLLNGELCTPTLSLPDEGYDPMYLSWEISGVTGIIPISQFTLVDCNKDSDVHVPSIYEFSTTIIADFSEICETEGAYHTRLYNISVQVSTFNLEGELVPYPACNHTAPGDIFDCNAFYAAQNYCDPINSSCENSDLIAESGGLDAFITCRARCDGSDPSDPVGIPHENQGSHTGGSDRSHSSDVVYEETISKSLSLQVTPNPFTTELMISWSQNTTPLVLRIMDTSGRTVKSWKEIGNTQNSSFNLDTSDLPKGMYILQLSDGKNSEFSKLIKS